MRQLKMRSQENKSKSANTKILYNKKEIDMWFKNNFAELKHCNYSTYEVYARNTFRFLPLTYNNTRGNT